MDRKRLGCGRVLALAVLVSVALPISGWSSQSVAQDSKSKSPLITASAEKIAQIEADVAKLAAPVRLPALIDKMTKSLEGRKLKSGIPKTHCYIDQNSVLLEVFWTIEASPLNELGKALESSMKKTGCAEMDAVLAEFSLALGRQAEREFRIDTEVAAFAAACRLGNKQACKHKMETSANLLRLSTLIKNSKYSNVDVDEGDFHRNDRDGWLVVRINPDTIRVDSLDSIPLPTGGQAVDPQTLEEFGKALDGAFAQEDADAKLMSRLPLHNTLILADERVGVPNLLALLHVLEVRSGKASVAVLWDQKKGRSMPVKLLRLDFVLSSFGAPVVENQDK